MSHYGAIWTRNTFRINTFLINYRTAQAVSGAPHPRAGLKCSENGHCTSDTKHRSVKSNTFNKVAQCLICKLRGPGIKRGNGSGM